MITEAKSVKKAALCASLINVNLQVAQYFDQHHGGLRYPHAHLVETKQGTKKNYYPPEVLFLADNQVVTVEQMDARSKAAMIKASLLSVQAARPRSESLVACRSAQFGPTRCSKRIWRPPKRLACARASIRSTRASRSARCRSRRTRTCCRRRACATAIASSQRRALRVGHLLSLCFCQSRLTTEKYEKANLEIIKRADKFYLILLYFVSAAWMAGNFLRPAITDGYAVYLLHRDQGRPDLSVKEIDAFTCEIDKICEQRRDLSIGKCRDKGIYKASC